MKIKSIKLLKGDLLIIAFVLILALIVFILSLPKNHNTNKVEIYLDGALIHTYSLDKNTQTTIEIEENYLNTIQINGDEVAVVASTCGDSICENTGYISKSDEVIVCLPNRLLIQVVGTDIDSEFDAVVG